MPIAGQAQPARLRSSPSGVLYLANDAPNPQNHRRAGRPPSCQPHSGWQRLRVRDADVNPFNGFIGRCRCDEL